MPLSLSGVVALSQDAFLHLTPSGDAVLFMPMFGVPNGALMHLEVIALGFTPLDDSEEPWVYTESGVFIKCVVSVKPELERV